MKVQFVWKNTDQSNINNVLISGSYDGWREKSALHKLENGDWEVELELQPGEIQFKFIVDGEYECSPDYEKAATIEGYENNYRKIELKVEGELFLPTSCSISINFE